MKENKQREIASDRSSSKNQNQIFQIVRKMVKERQDVTGSSFLKDATDKVVVDENRIKDMRLLLQLKNEKHKAPGLSVVEMIQATGDID